MDEDERKARDQQLRSSIHTKLIESGEYERSEPLGPRHHELRSLTSLQSPESG